MNYKEERRGCRVMMDAFNIVLALEKARTAEKEIKILEGLCRFLSPNKERQHVANDSDFDTEWLKNSGYGDVVNPYPGEQPQEILQEQESLNKFTFYLFERRYGWSEHSIHADPCPAVKEGSSHSNTGRSSSLGIESKFKGQLNDLLDDLLKWQVF